MKCKVVLIHKNCGLGQLGTQLSTGHVNWLPCRLKNLRNGFLIFFVEIYKQLTGDLRDVLNSLKSSTIDSIPQNVEETWYDDQENNEEQFQIGEAVASI